MVFPISGKFEILEIDPWPKTRSSPSYRINIGKALSEFLGMKILLVSL